VDAPIPISHAIKDQTGLVEMSHPQHKLVDLVAPAGLKQQLQKVLKEQMFMEKLRSHGLKPRRKILLVGSPGNGKTFTASVLSGELNYPLCKVRMDAVITKFMGESSAKLRQIFDAMHDVRGVYFFDEFDALGGERQASNDVGEARRILNNFLIMLEQDNSCGLIVCATNDVESLDRALFRRFDDIIYYGLPEESEVEYLLKAKLETYIQSDVTWPTLVQAAKGLSYAEIIIAIEDTIKDMIMESRDSISVSDILAALNTRQALNKRMATV
jgi:SpoVK/Ycf46/Vps4 family AAA+-type ATPase